MPETGEVCYSTETKKPESFDSGFFVIIQPYAAVSPTWLPWRSAGLWFLPAYIFLLDRFNPEECLKQYHGPVKFVIAGEDEVIGAASGLRLANGYTGSKEIQVISGAHHNDVAEQNPDWWREAFAFWQKNIVISPK